ncbi:MAG TPA: M6 family metalloprotease domain-containing protein [Longimicrobiales bacterium]|nr:M6 family metalloprotease domain-containing protein [Longimicrobiales bacterium]
MNTLPLLPGVHGPVSRLRRAPGGWRVPLLLAGMLVAGPSAAVGQDDVVLLGLRHGTTPPPAYFRLLAENPTAFRFSRGWMNRNPGLRVEGTGAETVLRPVDRGDLPLARSSQGPAGVLGQRDGAVEGTFLFPVVLGLFGGETTAAAYTRANVQSHFFDGPNTRGGTITQYYAEVSGGLVELLGEAQPWVRSSLNRFQVTGGVSGLGGSSQVGPFIVTLLQQLDDGSIDWGRFDNDGPDGIPNSGDDDGFVDVLSVIHPTAGAECSGARDRIWSHRWSLWSATGAPYATATPSANGGSVLVNDYTIQPLLACDGTNINDIGVFAHELGHGFGLPDLYCTAGNCGFAGIGEWGLMGAGAWGCDGDDPARPCHLSAWSKAVLGWATVETLPAGADLGTVTLEPAASSGRILRYDIPGTGEYYLLENRQRMGFDAGLHAPGLLVWHVDQDVLAAGWPDNRVNVDAARLGVGLVQADGTGGLQTSGGGRGDAGDPFPGNAGRTAFHAGSVPAAESHDGPASGLTLTELAQTGQDLTFRLLTRFHGITLATQGGSGTGSLLSVDGVPLPPGGGTVQGAPYQALSIRAEAGEALEPGVRTPFLGWDDGTASPERTFQVAFRDTAFVASYGGEEVQVGMALEGERFGVAPGSILSEPPSAGLWFPRGTAVTLTARPTRGFAFEAWTGALEGAPNPVGLVVDAPVTAGATFSFSFDVPAPAPLTLAAGDAVALALVAQNATPPVRWSVVDGALPPGMAVVQEGWVSGSPLATGSYAFTVRARDALGLEGTATLTLEVGEPALPFSFMAGSLLGSGSGPSGAQATYLDRSGNNNGRLDVGDVRAYLGRSAGGATVPAASGEIRRTLTVLTVRPGGAP